MPSEKLIRILLSKSSFSAAQIEAISEAQGWNWVYANAAPRKDKLPQICFTGFSASEKADLVVVAQAHKLTVATSVTKDLAFLCVGENAGPAKLAKAASQGVTILSRSQLEQLLETGEIAV